MAAGAADEGRARGLVDAHELRRVGHPQEEEGADELAHGGDHVALHGPDVTRLRLLVDLFPVLVPGRLHLGWSRAAGGPWRCVLWVGVDGWMDGKEELKVVVTRLLRWNLLVLWAQQEEVGYVDIHPLGS